MKSLFSGPRVIAHRGGAYAGVPGEQTTAHFERAVALGVDFIEVDLRETADQRIVCVHDPEYAGRVVAESTYDGLVDAARERGLPVPALLGELMEIARGRVHLDLEIKAGGFEDRLLEAVRAFDRAIIYKCFRDPIVARLKELSPTCFAGLLLGVDKPRNPVRTRMSELFPGERVRKCRADFVSPHHRLVRFGFVERMRAGGLPVLVWTVNDAALAARMLSTGSSVITDDPAMCLSLRAQK